MENIEGTMYSGEARKVLSVKNKCSCSTTFSYLDRYITNWENLNEFLKINVVRSGLKVDFILWNNGKNHGIKITNGYENKVIHHSCSFEIAKQLFIHDLLEQEVDQLAIVKKSNFYCAKYRIKYNPAVSNFIYEGCDALNLDMFLEDVLKINQSKFFSFREQEKIATATAEALQKEKKLSQFGIEKGKIMCRTHMK